MQPANGTSLGLFDGFEAYRTPSADDYRDLLKRALVVFDTNVLLNLYRYSVDTRKSVVAVMAALGDRFWIPNHVLEEFWRNRERALGSPISEVNESISSVARHRDQVFEILGAWVNKAALSEDEVKVAKAELGDAFERLSQLLDAVADEDEVARARSTAQDPVLEMLEPVLRGRVGEPMPKREREAAIKEGQRRAAAGEPPGFADVKKADLGPEGAAGDYLVWSQTLLEAEKRKLDVLFVTGDVKRDWWRYESGTPRGPRIELARELRSRSGTALYMIKPDRLLTFASVLSVEVEPSSVTNIERATRRDEPSVMPDGEDPATDAPAGDAGFYTATAPTHWNAVGIDMLLKRLGRGAPVQQAVLRRAALNGGYISRQEVYEIGEYEPERQLKGFTRPVNRIVEEMRTAGIISTDAEDVLVPVYDAGDYGFGWVDGYRVPSTVAALISIHQGQAVQPQKDDS